VNSARRNNQQVKQPIHPMEKLEQVVRERGVRMAIVSVPGTAAQEVTNRLINCGIAGILNFAPIVLQVPEDVTVNNVNLAIELENLSYFIQD
jgi:redox-sensing transcriptional repressor